MINRKLEKRSEWSAIKFDIKLEKTLIYFERLNNAGRCSICKAKRGRAH